MSDVVARRASTASAERTGSVVWWRRISRRHLQVALGVLWLVDAGLQAQPFMFTRAFGTQLIASTGQGQPTLVSGPVHWTSTVLAAHPFAWNLGAVAIQALLGIGLLLRQTVRIAILGSIGWALAVWYLGEGLSGLASGHASLLLGAPGSALLYVVLVAAAWPTGSGRRTPPAHWLIWAWAVLWIGAGVYQLLPAQRGAAAVAAAFTGNVTGAPHWLARLDASIGNWVTSNGVRTACLLAGAEVSIGIGVLTRRTRAWSLAAGVVLSLAIWLTAQDIGLLYSGEATDPNSAPLIVLMALAVLPRVGSSVAGPHRDLDTVRQERTTSRLDALPGTCKKRTLAGRTRDWPVTAMPLRAGTSNVPSVADEPILEQK